MSQNLRDWRGNTTRFLEGENLVDQVREVTKAMQSTKLCELSSKDGSVKCRFLISARSQWLTSILPLVESSIEANKDATVGVKIGVSQGMAIGVTWIATCQECKRRTVQSTTLLVDLIPLLSLKSLALKPPECTFITWRLEIGNTYKTGNLAMYT